MQGRLLPKYKGRFQAHPVSYWSEEFPLAQERNLDLIEFILDFNDPQELHLDTFLYNWAKVLAKGLTSSSLLVTSFKTILLADLGPKPGSFEINLTRSSISFIFCIILKRPLKSWNSKTASSF